MSRPVLRFSVPYIGMRNCETGISLAICIIWPVFAMFVGKLYNVNVFTVSKSANRVFIFRLKGRLGTESGDSLLTVKTAKSPFLIGDKL